MGMSPERGVLHPSYDDDARVFPADRRVYRRSSNVSKGSLTLEAVSQFSVSGRIRHERASRTDEGSLA